MLYYDCFDVSEEEEFLECEKQRCQTLIQSLIRRIQHKDPTLTEIVLDVTLETLQLTQLVDALCQYQCHHVQRLCISHWGLGDAGIPELIKVIPFLAELSLTSCGITSTGVHPLLLA